MVSILRAGHCADAAGLTRAFSCRVVDGDLAGAGRWSPAALGGGGPLVVAGGASLGAAGPGLTGGPGPGAGLPAGALAGLRAGAGHCPRPAVQVLS